MRGPIPLDPSEVNLRVPSRLSGVYCLGKTVEEATFVARADHDLKEEIKANEGKYHYFWFEPSLTPTERYSTHCRWFHRLNNSGHFEAGGHPQRPVGVNVPCPVCGE